MYPILVDAFGVVLPSWHVFFVLGAIYGFFYFRFLNDHSQSPLADKAMRQYYCIVYLAGLLGARGLNILVESWGQPLSILDFLTQLVSLGGLTFYGGPLAGIVAGVTYGYVKKLDIKNLFNISIPPVFAALILGRIGCFLNGDDYGTPTPEALSFLGIVNPVLEDGILRFPVQLYESFLVAIPVFCGAYTIKIRKSPLLNYFGPFFLVYYAIVRFCLEYLRGDARGYWLEPYLSTSQGISLALIMAVAAVAAYGTRRQSRSPSST